MSEHQTVANGMDGTMQKSSHWRVGKQVVKMGARLGTEL